MLVSFIALSSSLAFAQETNEQKTDSLATFQFLEEVVVSSRGY